jgi:hypothetical protein
LVLGFFVSIDAARLNNSLFDLIRAVK